MRTQLRSRSISDFSYTPLAAALALALAPQAGAATITVLSQADSGPGTLRDAINTVNASCSPTNDDVINFATFSNGPFIVSVSSDLPFINCDGLTIDGGGNEASNGIFGPYPAVLQNISYGGGGEFGLVSFTSSIPVTIKGMEVRNWTYGTGIGGNVIASDNIVHGNDHGFTGFDNATISHNRVFANSTGIFVAYGGETVSANIVYNNVYGIEVADVPYGGNIANNFVGIDDGSRADLGLVIGNSYGGILAYGSLINISGNVVSNNDEGIIIDGDLGSTIGGNKIGTDASGTSVFGNAEGIEVDFSSGTSITGNVVSGNYDGGIFLFQSSNISITGNVVGSDSSVTLHLENASGISATCGSNVLVQNNTIIAASYGNAIEFDAITGGGTMDITGNKINVAGDGVTPLGNSAYGIVLRDTNCVSAAPAFGKSKHAKKVGAKRIAAKTIVAGATTGLKISGNIVSYSSEDGIVIDGGYNNQITGNTITNNSAYGIDISLGFGNSILDNTAIYGNGGSLGFPKNVNLGFSGGVLPNDTGDVDTDPTPNNGQNWPVINSVTRSGGNTNVTFTLDSTAGGYKIEACQNSPATTEPGCSAIVGSTTVSIAGAPVSGTIVIPGTSADFISLNATNTSTGDTSEFSPVSTAVSTPGVLYSATGMNFGNVALNTTSPPITITLTSVGTGNYNIGAIGSPTCYGGSICYGGPFTCTTTCTTGDYVPGASCSITATFHPTVIGAYGGSIGICDNVSPSYGGTITLAGTGVVPPPTVIDPTSYDFGSVLINTVSPSHRFVVDNPGVATVPIGPPIVSTGFNIIGTDCGTSLAPFNTCNVDVTFNPTVPGAVSGSLTIGGVAPSKLSIKRAGRKAAAAPLGGSLLTGTGAVEAILSLPPGIDFGAYTAGTPPIIRSVSLTNNGNAVLFLSNISVSGPFTLTNDCPDGVAPGDSCELILSYSDADLGPQAGALLVVSSAGSGSASIPLTATTVAIPVPIITIAPKTIGFGDRLFGSASDSQRITIGNIGNAPATLALSVTSLDFLIVNTTCGTSLAPAASCFADVALRPAGFGVRQGAFKLDTNAVGSPFSVPMSGSGCRPFSIGSSRLGSSFSCAP